MKSLMNFTKNYKVFWRARALKTQIFKELKGIFFFLVVVNDLRCEAPLYKYVDDSAITETIR